MTRPQIKLNDVLKMLDSASDIVYAELQKLANEKMISEKDVVKPNIHIWEPVFAVAIRGYYKDTMGKPGQNDIGIYDDALILVGPNYFQTFNANTDPAKHNPGISTLLVGLHYFKQGLHGFNRSVPSYKAFRPNTPDEKLPVLRWGQFGIQKGQYINIHKGGEIYTNSAGCQTIRPEQYSEWQTSCYKLMDNESQKQLPYLLLPVQ